MAYIKLSSKLRKTLEEIEHTMRLSGYTADLRWLEQCPGVCPMCGEENTRPATISTVGVPEAGMIHIPYCVCEACVARHYGGPGKGFDEARIGAVEERIFSALKVERGVPYTEKVPEGFRESMIAMLDAVQGDGYPVHPGWLQNRTLECPGCGTTMTDPLKNGLSIGAVRGRPVAVPYLVCHTCGQHSDEQLNKMVYPRIMAMLTSTGTTHH